MVATAFAETAPTDRLPIGGSPNRHKQRHYLHPEVAAIDRSAPSQPDQARALLALVRTATDLTRSAYSAADLARPTAIALDKLADDLLEKIRAVGESDLAQASAGLADTAKQADGLGEAIAGLRAISAEPSRLRTSGVAECLFDWTDVVERSLTPHLPPRLNLGCGRDTSPDWTNVDLVAGPRVLNDVG